MKNYYIHLVLLIGLLCIVLPASAATWYVDDDGDADFTTIQDAVNAASPGDTILVRDGTYREALVIDRQVTLEAVNRGMVRIVVSAAAQVTADRVTIRGIVIRGSDEIPRARPWQDLSLTSVTDCLIEGCEFWDGGIVLSSARNCTVRDSLFTETYRAVDLEGSQGNLIEGNVISWNRDYAIYAESSSNNRIVRNRMYGAEGGGTIDLWDSHNNTITENVLDGYDPFGAQSLCLHTGSSGNVIYFNDFLNSNYPTLFSDEVRSNTWNATTPVNYTWNGRTLTGYPGNYWQVPDGSGYSGSDDDGDGLGDTPYTLRRSDQSDCHPLMGPAAEYLPEEETTPTWIVVSPSTPAIVAGETHLFMARCSDQHGVRLYDLPVVWSCDNQAVGTIDDDGLFTAIGPGTTTVTAAAGDVAGRAYVTVVEQTPAEGNATIVVNRSGGGDYTTIGDAVAAAGAGDQIVVHPGTYTETVQVTTPVTITGSSGAASTIIQAPDLGSPCVIVLSGGVSITGFTFSGGKRAPAVLVRGVSGGRIADVVAQEGYEGIRLDCSSNILIENLKVPGLTDDVRETHLGVVLVNGSFENRIEGCTLSTKEYAVWIEESTCNSVTNSTLYGRARGGSVALFRSDANTVTGNDLDCPNMGLHGVFLWQSEKNRIWFNNFLEGHIHTFSGESRNYWVSETPVSYYFDGAEYTGRPGNYWEVVPGYPDNGYSGSDGDGDGIGDTAYPVPHCDSGDTDTSPLIEQIDRYTLVSAPVPPVASFTANVTAGEAPLAVAFTDTSSNATSWSWDFGDGATSNEQHPVHVYTAAGTYTVTLTAANAAGSDTATASIAVSSGGSGGEPKTWYVDAGGSGDFTTIQAAIDAASAGDTIVVKDGAYTENVDVNKPLTITSEHGPDDVTVTARVPTTPVFEILADGVTIRDFTVRGPTNEHVAGIESVGYDDCLIMGNDCGGECYNGIHLGGNATNCTVTENYCHDNTKRGLSLRDDVYGNYVYDNYCIGNAENQVCIKDYSHDNYLWANTFIGTVECLTDNIYHSPASVTYTHDGVEHTGYVGNYYGGYTGTDADGDGIGDTPMNLGYDKYTFTFRYGEYPLMGAWENGSVLDGTDLAIASLDLPTGVINGTACTVNGTVENLGVTISSPCSVALVVNGTGIGSVALGSLATGATSAVSFSWTPSAAGETNLTLAIDAATAVLDVDRTNNNQTAAVIVADPGSGSDTAPVAGFTANVTSGKAPLAVAFTDTSSNTPTAWSWTFGDGDTSNEQHPVHVYTSAGTYTVGLTAANAAGSNSTTTFITVSSGGSIEPADHTIALYPGWNFVSTPKRLADGQNTIAIFDAVDTADHSVLLYNGTSRWEAMSSNETFEPLDGIWIYANGSYAIPLAFSPGSPQTPPEKDLDRGWNAIGFTDTVPEAAANTLRSVDGKWATLFGYDAERQAYDVSIIRGAGGRHSEMREMSPMQGYWLYMNDAGTLAAIGA